MDEDEVKLAKNEILYLTTQVKTIEDFLALDDEIMKILKDLNEKGTTVIIITHNDEIANLSKRVVRIHDGKIDSDEIREHISSYGEINEKEEA